MAHALCCSRIFFLAKFRPNWDGFCLNLLKVFTLLDPCLFAALTASLEQRSDDRRLTSQSVYLEREVVGPRGDVPYLREPSTQNSVTAKFITQLP